MLDGGCPWYDTYETRDGGYVAVGALEPKFFELLLRGLGIGEGELPGKREDRGTWPELRRMFERRFKEKSRKEWESIFDGTDACVTPVLGYDEMKQAGSDQRPIVTLKGSPAFAIADVDGDTRPAATGQGIGVDGEEWTSKGLKPGEGGEEVLARWMGWKAGRHYEVHNGGLIKLDVPRDSKL